MSIEQELRLTAAEYPDDAGGALLLRAADALALAEKALHKYGAHTIECNSISLTMTKNPTPNGRPCDCGLDAALKGQNEPPS